jgi:hypothetical protein
MNLTEMLAEVSVTQVQAISQINKQIITEK